MINFQRVVVVLASVSGAGKTTLANYLKWQSVDHCEIVCADDYFSRGGEYRFNPREIGAAHKECRENFNNFLEIGTNLIIVANTSTRRADRDYYISTAKEKGYTVFSFILENVNGTKNIHNVPEETLIRQENQLKESLKLR